jgi:hypothetical protein
VSLNSKLKEDQFSDYGKEERLKFCHEFLGLTVGGLEISSLTTSQ